MSAPQVKKDGIEKVFEFDIDLKRPTQYEDIMLVEGDTKNKFIIHLYDDGEPVDLTGCRVWLTFSHADGTAYQDSAASSGQLTQEGNTLTCRLKTGSFSEGLVECEIRIFSGLTVFGQTTSSRFNFMCRRSILNERTVESEVKDSPLLGLIEQANEAIQKANKAVVDANLALGAATGGGKVDIKVYLHIRYSAQDPREHNYDIVMSTTPAAYIGTAVTDSETAPSDPREYVWYRWKGEAGMDGSANRVYVRYSPTDPSLTRITPSEIPGRYMGICVTEGLNAPEDQYAYDWYLIEGSAGRDGKDGVSVTGVESRNGNIVFKLSDKSELSLETSGIMSGLKPATGTAPGLMSSGDKTKLDELRAFSSIAISDSTRGGKIEAQTAQDMAVLTLGENMSVDFTDGVKLDAKLPDEATRDTAGLMSYKDKRKLDDLTLYSTITVSDGMKGYAFTPRTRYDTLNIELGDKLDFTFNENDVKFNVKEGATGYDSVEFKKGTEVKAQGKAAESEGKLSVTLGEYVECEKNAGGIKIGVNIPEGTQSNAGLISAEHAGLIAEVSAFVKEMKAVTFMQALTLFVQRNLV